MSQNMTTCKQNKQHLVLKTPINQQNNKKYQLRHFVCWTGILHQSGEHLQMSSLKFKFTLPTCITDYIFKNPVSTLFIYRISSLGSGKDPKCLPVFHVLSF